MKKYFNLTGFYPFERKQFEDFLNDMAKKGYHLKSFNSFFSEYEENNDEIYYHVAIKEKKNMIFNEPCDESYMTFFEDNGYHFIDKQGIFYVFATDKPCEMYTDEQIDEEVIKKQSINGFKNYIISLVIFLLLGGFFGFLTLSFDDLLSTENILDFYFLRINIIFIGCCRLFFIYYFMKKEVHYSYHLSLIRDYCLTFVVMLLILGDKLFTRNFIYLPLFLLVLNFILAIVICIYGYKKSNPVLLQKYALFLFIMFVGLGICGQMKKINNKSSYIKPAFSLIQDYQISNDSHSIVIDYYEYQKENKTIKYVNILDHQKSLDILNLYLQDHYTKYQKHQIDGYLIYQTPISTIIYKNNQFIEMKKIENQQFKQFLIYLNW